MVTDWKLIKIEEALDRESAGSKAAGLGILKRAGFRVPEGWVLTRNLVDRILSVNGLDEAILGELSRLDRTNVKELAGRLRDLIKDLKLPEELKEELRHTLKPDQRYAVRSSGTLEDLDEASFAGQYKSYLNVSPQEVPAQIAACIRSMWSEPILSYMVHHGMDPARAGMAVILQDMVHADTAGVMFSVNPTTGADTEVVIEAVRGLSDQLMSGMLIPESFRYDWFEEKIIMAPDSKILTKGQIMLLGKAALRIQKLFGYPVDIEFATQGGRSYAIQARPVTRINYSGLKDQWTTADFKDGGVSAGVCTPLMWSLYEYVWDTELKRFLLESSILTEKEIRKLSKMFYGRPYWNMSVVKTAISKIPGYKEREFDREFGVQAGYAGEGMVTRITPASMGRLLKISLAQKKILKDREMNAQKLKEELLQGYESVSQALDQLEGDDLKSAWIRLVRDLYLKSEGTYFWQIFINTIHQSINRDEIMKYVDLETYHVLISGLTNVSHLRPFYEMWELSGTVLPDPEAVKFWLNTDLEELKKEIAQGINQDHELPKFRELLRRYEYHSDHELDISWPDYSEDPSSFILSFRDTLKLKDEFNPDAGKLKVHRDYLEALEKVGKNHGPLARSRVQKRIEKTRSMLWWREEFRDISTRYYHAIRLYSLKLGEQLVQEGVFTEVSDIWFLKMDDTVKLLEGRFTKEFAAGLIRRSRNYYESFRNFTSENEIGEGFQRIEEETGAGLLARGLPGSHGRIQGTARVISGLEEMDRIQPGDILVTKFTDTGWTSKFAMLSGVITEYGGVLCHAAIVSREYGIPCIIGTKDAMSLIKDGERILMDGGTGEIRREEA